MSGKAINMATTISADYSTGHQHVGSYGNQYECQVIGKRHENFQIFWQSYFLSDQLLILLIWHGKFPSRQSSQKRAFEKIKKTAFLRQRSSIYWINKNHVGNKNKLKMIKSEINQLRSEWIK